MKHWLLILMICSISLPIFAQQPKHKAITYTYEHQSVSYILSDTLLTITGPNSRTWSIARWAFEKPNRAHIPIVLSHDDPNRLPTIHWDQVRLPVQVYRSTYDPFHPIVLTKSAGSRRMLVWCLIE